MKQFLVASVLAAAVMVMTQPKASASFRFELSVGGSLCIEFHPPHGGCGPFGRLFGGPVMGGPVMDGPVYGEPYHGDGHISPVPAATAAPPLAAPAKNGQWTPPPPKEQPGAAPAGYWYQTPAQQPAGIYYPAGGYGSYNQAPSYWYGR